MLDPGTFLRCCIRFGGVLAIAWSPSGASADPDPDPPIVRTDPARASAVRPAALPEDPSAFTTIIDPEDFAGEAQTVEALLSQSVGVQVRRFGGPGQRSEISIRGSTPAQVVIQLDGVRLNSAQSGAVDLSTLPLSMIERIEVSRGGGSVQAGSDAVGGVVNLITRRPGERRTRLFGGAASFGTWRGGASHSQRVGDAEFSIAYDGFKTEGDWEFRRPVRRLNGVTDSFVPDHAERINNESETHALLAHAGHPLGDWGHVSFEDYLSYTSRGQPGFDLSSGPLAGQREHAHERLARNLAILKFEGTDPDVSGVDATWRTYHRYERGHFADPVRRLPLDPASAIDTLTRNETYGSQLTLDRSFTRLGEHAARLALDWRLDELRRNGLKASDRVNRSRRSIGVMLQDDWALFGGRVRVLPGLRFDDTEDFRREWLPRIGLIVSPWPWLQIKGNAEESYRAPNLDELFFPDKEFIRGNPSLVAERADNFDAGFEVALEKLGVFRNLRLEAAAFRQEIDNSIVFVLINTSTLRAENTGPASVDGFELSGSFDLLGWLGVSGNHTHQDATLDRTGTPLPGRARNESSLRLVLGPPSGVVKLVGQAQRTSEIPVSDTGLTRVSDRTVYDASISVELTRIGCLRPYLPGRSLLLSVGGKNLSDRSVRDAQFFPQPGRTLFFELAAEL